MLISSGRFLGGPQTKCGASLILGKKESGLAAVGGGVAKGESLTLRLYVRGGRLPEASNDAVA